MKETAFLTVSYSYQILLLQVIVIILLSQIGFLKIADQLDRI